MGGGDRFGGANHCPYSTEILERSLGWCCHCWSTSKSEERLMYGDQEEEVLGREIDGLMSW